MWLQLLANLSPFILAFIPKLQQHPALIPAIVGGLQVAEQIPNATGPEKKNLVLTLVKTGIDTANATHGSVLINSDDTVAAASAGIDTVIHTINAIHSVNGGTK